MGAETLARMQRRVPLPGGRTRPVERLCAGQTLLCRALGLRVPEWDGVTLGESRGEPPGRGPLVLLDVGYRPRAIVRTTRLGIPPGRDGHLPYRFVDAGRAAQATRNPIPRTRRTGAPAAPPVAVGAAGVPAGGAAGTTAQWIDLPLTPAPPDWEALLGEP
jgi:DNA-3-methyladenine glycosylase